MNPLGITESDLQSVKENVRALVDDFIENGFTEEALADYFVEKE